MTRNRRHLAPLIGLALACVTAATAWAAVTWQPWSAPEYGVSTSLPGTPQVTVSDGKAGQDVQALAIGEDESAYLVRIDQFDWPAGDRRKSLGRIIARLGDDFTGPVLSREDITVDGYPGIEATTGPNPKGLYVRVRIIAKDDRLIQLLIVRDTLPPPDRFHGDLKLTPPGSEAP